MQADRQVVHAEGAPAAIGPYSHAVSGAGLLFCSGQIPLDPESGELDRRERAGAGAAVPEEPGSRLCCRGDVAGAGDAADRLHDRPR